MNDIKSRQKSVKCQSCQYDLRGINADVCPECGNPISADVLSELPDREGIIDNMSGILIAIFVMWVIVVFSLKLDKSDDANGAIVAVVPFVWTVVAVLCSLAIAIGRSVAQQQPSRGSLVVINALTCITIVITIAFSIILVYNCLQ